MMTHDEIKEELKKHFDIVYETFSNTHEVVGVFKVDPDRLIKGKSEKINSIALIAPNYRTLITRETNTYNRMAFPVSKIVRNDDVSGEILVLDVTMIKRETVYRNVYMIDWLFTKNYYVARNYSRVIQDIRSKRYDIVNCISIELMLRMMKYLGDMSGMTTFTDYGMYNHIHEIRHDYDMVHYLSKSSAIMIDKLIDKDYDAAFVTHESFREIDYNLLDHYSLLDLHAIYKNKVEQYRHSKDYLLSPRTDIDNILINFVTIIMLITHQGALAITLKEVGLNVQN